MSPFVSKKQMRWMYTNKPAMAKKWEDKYGAYKSIKKKRKWIKKK